MGKILAAHIKEVLDLHQKQVATSVSEKELLTDKQSFDAHQAAFFDKQAFWYCSEKATPHEVHQRLESMFVEVKKHLKEHRLIASNILDVGSGAGVLIPYYEKYFLPKNIVAIDLSTKQLDNLKAKYPKVEAIVGDIASFDSKTPFDLIFCNACFGNFYSQRDVLRNISNLLSDSGVLIISHPLGANFVEKLHQQDQNTVLHILPNNLTDYQTLLIDIPLSLEKLIFDNPYYLAILKRQ